MKYVILSADNNPSVYLVPNIVADNLWDYCTVHFYKWLYQSPVAKKYYKGGGYCFNETAFIEYLNITFPYETSYLIETLGRIKNKNDIPERYQNCKRFDF